jgi:dihydrodiol dehydrogenase / D-xylose 1-dehydrogenase (NADP)
MPLRLLIMTFERKLLVTPSRRSPLPALHLSRHTKKIYQDNIKQHVITKDSPVGYPRNWRHRPNFVRSSRYPTIPRQRHGLTYNSTTDLLLDPNTRGVKHLKHTVVAAASSSSKSRAEQFLKDTGCPSDAKAYGSYEELVKDSNIDIVYVATPHSHHYQNAMLCLEAGKNVLCEKAFTVNAAQARKLAEKAREKNLFLMEAVWTRYFPLSIYVREQITSGRIGPVSRVLSDNSLALDPENNFSDGKHRMVNPDLAGGALLDLGIYALTWVFQTLYHTQPEKDRQPPKLLAYVKNYEATGKADEASTMILSFPRSKEAGGEAHAVATTSLRVATAPGNNMDTPCVRVQGPKGEVQVFPHSFRPTKTKLILSDGTVEDKEWPIPGPGKGSGWYVFAL